MPARRHRLDDHRIQPLGCGVDGSRQPGRPCPDDAHIVQVRRVDPLRQAQFVGERARRRIPEHPFTRQDHDRQLVLHELEACEEPAGVRVAIGIEKPMRVAVPRQEALQPQGISGMAGADQHDAAMRMPDQADATQDEGAHDDFADVRLGDDEAPEIGPLDPDDAAVLARPCADQDLAIVEQVELTGELVCPLGGEDGGEPVGIGVEDLDRPFDDEEEVDTPFASAEEQRAGRN